MQLNALAKLPTKLTCQIRPLSLFLALACVAASANAAPPADLAQTLVRIDEDFTTFLASKCTEPRKQLCSAMKGFRSGTLPSADMVSRPFYLGRLYALHMSFKQSLDYSRTTALLMFGGTHSKRLARFEQLSSDTADEQAQIDAAQQRIAQGKDPLESELTRYVANLASQDLYLHCEATETAYLCRADSASTPVLLVRQYNGKLYTVEVGKVPFRPRSFDKVPGFYIGEYEGGHN